jgi:hypothetical protein
MLKIKNRKINTIYIQETVWLVFVIAVSWALITARSNDSQVSVSSNEVSAGTYSIHSQTARP